MALAPDYEQRLYGLGFCLHQGNWYFPHVSAIPHLHVIVLPDHMPNPGVLSITLRYGNGFHVVCVRDGVCLGNWTALDAQMHGASTLATRVLDAVEAH